MRNWLHLLLRPYWLRGLRRHVIELTGWPEAKAVMFITLHRAAIIDAWAMKMGFLTVAEVLVAAVADDFERLLAGDLDDEARAISGKELHAHAVAVTALGLAGSIP